MDWLALSLVSPYNSTMLRGFRGWRVARVVALLMAIVASPVVGQPGRELRIGVRGIPAIPDPATALEGTTPLIARQVFETLVQYKIGRASCRERV